MWEIMIKLSFPLYSSDLIHLYFKLVDKVYYFSIDVLEHPDKKPIKEERVSFGFRFQRDK